ncbi:hypothetical protein Tco_1003367 [Tanacetum coccineum]|uniref:Uncharacterized protein n=1 Tax=Tanacetum coccineum TaxID=301880 RepID=A0ABQ5F9G9_9ASTR
MSVKYPNYVNLTSSSEEQPNERTPSPPPRKKSLSPPQAPSKSISRKSTHYTSSPSPKLPPPQMSPNDPYAQTVDNWPPGPSNPSPPPRVSRPPPGFPNPPPGFEPFPSTQPLFVNINNNTPLIHNNAPPLENIHHLPLNLGNQDFPNSLNILDFVHPNDMPRLHNMFCQCCSTIRHEIQMLQNRVNYILAISGFHAHGLPYYSFFDFKLSGRAVAGNLTSRRRFGVNYKMTNVVPAPPTDPPNTLDGSRVWEIYRLPNRLNLSSRGLDLDSISCMVYNGSVESNAHTFFTCDTTAVVWRLVRSWIGFSFPSFLSCEDWVSWFDSWLALKDKKFSSSKREHCAWSTEAEIVRYAIEYGGEEAMLGSDGGKEAWWW